MSLKTRNGNLMVALEVMSTIKTSGHHENLWTKVVDDKQHIIPSGSYHTIDEIHLHKYLQWLSEWIQSLRFSLRRPLLHKAVYLSDMVA